MNGHTTYPLTADSWGSSDYVRRIGTGLIAGTILSLLIAAAVWVLSAGISPTIGSADAWGTGFCQWLYDSSIGRGLRESQWMFPIVEGTHLLGIALSVGVLCWFDLRLLGLVLQDQPVSKVWRQLMPTAFFGFALMFATGVLLFWAEAITAYHSVHFWLKMALIGLAGVNALIFEGTAHRGMAAWDAARVPPARARIAGFVSLVLWTGIIIMGRTMAYSF